MSNRWKAGFIQAFFDPLTVGPALPYGPLYVWGNNNSGELGQNDVVLRSSPTQVSSSTPWSALSAGQNFRTAIKNDGTAWSFGNNNYGQLAIGNRVFSSSPVQIGALTDWYDSKVVSGYGSTCAVKPNGTIWVWGQNGSGRLGDGTVINRSSPVQVGALTTWLKITVGYSATHALKTDGTLWSWGNGSSGETGHNDVINRSSPVQIGSDTDWLDVASGSNHTVATKTDGTIYSWGGNAVGVLGLNDINIKRSSPTQIGALTNWSKVFCGQYFTGSIKTDGTLWIWGENGARLGDGTVINRSSPIQIGSDTNWTEEIEGNSNSVTAIKSDGTLWVWGQNDKGQLGTGDRVYVSSPVQIGSETSWGEVSKGGNWSTAPGAVEYS